MIQTIKITDLDTILTVAKKGKELSQSAWLSTVDKEDREAIKEIRTYMDSKDIPYHVEYFYDYDDSDSNVSNAPEPYHIEKIISFLKKLIESDKAYDLGINCYAGISRSTALGIVAWVLQGQTPEQALLKILKVRPFAWPNLRILRIASEIINQDILSPIKEWTDEKSKELYTDPNGSF